MFDETVLGLHECAFGIQPEMLDERAATSMPQPLATVEVDRQIGNPPLCLGRRWGRGDLRNPTHPGRVYDRLEYRQRDARSRAAVPKGAMRSIGIVIADPNHDRYIVGKPGEPRVVFFFRRA